MWDIENHKCWTFPLVLKEDWKEVLSKEFYDLIKSVGEAAYYITDMSKKDFENLCFSKKIYDEYFLSSESKILNKYSFEYNEKLKELKVDKDYSWKEFFLLYKKLFH